MHADADPYRAPAAPADVPSRTSVKAILSLVFGLTFCCGALTGLPAVILGVLGLSEINNSGGALRGRGIAIAGIVSGSLTTLLGTIGVLVALLLPAIQAARTAARRSSSGNNLKQVALGIHNYSDTHHQFPAHAIADADGQPLLSWRVAILPYIDESQLAEQFKLDESWEGPMNGPLADRAPPAYLAPGDSDRNPGRTNVLAIVGPDTLFSPGETLTMRDCTDGLSRTIMAVELAGFDSPWSAPADITVDEFVAAVARDLAADGALRPVYPGGVLCVFGDGSVHFIPSGADPAVLRALTTRAGGETIPVETLFE